MSRVKVDIVGDKSNLDAALKGVSHSLEGLKELAIGAFSIEAVAAMIEKTVEYADTIDKTSLRMKMTTDETQALGIMAKQAGTDLGTIEEAFRKIELARSKALGGDADFRKSFKALGIDVGELSKSNNTADLAAKLASAGANGSNDKEGVDLQKLGLKSTAGDLIAIGDALGHLKEKTQELKAQGAIMSDEDIASLVRAKEEMEIVGTKLEVAIAPAIAKIAELLEKGWIIFETAAEHTFTAIILMAQHVVEFVKNLGTSALSKNGSAIKGGLTGFAAGGGGISGLVGGLSGFISGALVQKDSPAGKLVKDLSGDLKDSFAGTMDDISAKLKDFDDEVAAQLAERNKQRQNKPTADAPIMPVKHEGKAYSDALSGGGNLLGQSLSNIGSVTSLVDINKQQLSEHKKQTNILLDIAQKAEDRETNQYGWWSHFS